MSNDTLGNIILRLLVDNKAFAEGLKNALQLVSISSRQMKDLMQFKIDAPDFTALDLAVEANQKSIQELISTQEQEIDVTKRAGAEKDRAAGSFGRLSDAGQKAFFTIQGGLSVINLMRSTVGELITKSNEGAISQNKLAFATREIEERTPGATQRMLEYAAALRDKTGFEKDSIITAQANLAATFKEEEAVRRLTPLLIDIAAFKKSNGEAGADLTSITQALTRAVNGEAGALSRLGIFLDESVVKSGDVNRIVTELERNFGGYAEQQDKNVVAQAVFNDRLNDTKQALGGLLTNALTPVLTPVGDLLRMFTDLPSPIQSATVAAAGFGAVMLFVNTTLGGLPLLIGGIITAGAGLFGLFNSLSGDAAQSAEDVAKSKEELRQFKELVDSLSPTEIDFNINDVESEIARVESQLKKLDDKAFLGFFFGFDAGENSAQFDKLNKDLLRLKETLDILRASKELKFSVVPPNEIETIGSLSSQIDALTEKRKTASASEIADINTEIAALQKKKQALEELGTDAGARAQVSLLERRLQLGEISREQFERELQQLRAVAKEEGTRLDLNVRLKQSAVERSNEQLKELDLKRKSGQITNEVYIAELKAALATTASAEKKLEIQQKITGAIAEQVKQEQEAEARKNAIIIAGITDRFEKQRAQADEHLRQELAREQTVLDSATATDEQKRQAEANMQQLKQNNILALAEIDRQQAEETSRRKLQTEEQMHQLKVVLAQSQLETEVLQINQKYDQAEERARKLFSTEDQLSRALTQLKAARDRELFQAQLRSIQRSIAASSSVLQNVINVASALNDGGSQFVRDMQRALQIAQAIAAIMNTIGIFSSLFSFGGGSGRAVGAFAGAAAGGGTFVTQGPTALIVGDNPGGRELVEVTPLSGKGETKIWDNSLLSFAGGGKLMTFDDVVDPGIMEYIRSGGAPGSIALPQGVINMIMQPPGTSREELSVVIDELRRLNEKVDNNTRETRDLADRINIKLPDEINLRADGHELRKVIRRDEERDF